MFKKSLLIAIVGFSVGYFTNNLLPVSVAGVNLVTSNQQECEPKNVLAEAHTLGAQQALVRSSAVSQSSSVAPNNSQAKSSVQSTKLADEPFQTPTENQPVESKSSRAVEKENIITDAEIDAIIPAPFNQQLKGIQGLFREKYKDFANAEQSDDWDVLMRGRIEDAIYSNPYGKMLTIESLVCKSGICEVRLYETKYGAWNLVLAEMQLQTWWEFDSKHSSGFSTQLNGVDVIGHYVLIDRKRH